MTHELDQNKSEIHMSNVYWLGRLASVMQEQFNLSAAQHDVSWAQWLVLSSIYNGVASTPAQIADHIGVDRSAITRLVDRLESKMLVVRNRESVDRRSISVELTVKGKNILPTLADIAEHTEKALLEGVTAEQQHVFNDVIQLLISQHTLANK